MNSERVTEMSGGIKEMRGKSVSWGKSVGGLAVSVLNEVEILDQKQTTNHGLVNYSKLFIENVFKHLFYCKLVRQ